MRRKRLPPSRSWYTLDLGCAVSTLRAERRLSAVSAMCITPPNQLVTHYITHMSTGFVKQLVESRRYSILEKNGLSRTERMTRDGTGRKEIGRAHEGKTVTNEELVR